MTAVGWNRRKNEGCKVSHIQKPVNKDKEIWKADSILHESIEEFGVLD